MVLHDAAFRLAPERAGPCSYSSVPSLGVAPASLAFSGEGRRYSSLWRVVLRVPLGSARVCPGVGRHVHVGRGGRGLEAPLPARERRLQVALKAWWVMAMGSSALFIGPHLGSIRFPPPPWRPVCSSSVPQLSVANGQPWGWFFCHRPARLGVRQLSAGLPALGEGGLCLLPHRHHGHVVWLLCARWRLRGGRDGRCGGGRCAGPPPTGGFEGPREAWNSPAALASACAALAVGPARPRASFIRAPRSRSASPGSLFESGKPFRACSSVMLVAQRQVVVARPSAPFSHHHAPALSPWPAQWGSRRLTSCRSGRAPSSPARNGRGEARPG